jgi:hypothetical protein
MGPLMVIKEFLEENRPEHILIKNHNWIIEQFIMRVAKNNGIPLTVH